MYSWSNGGTGISTNIFNPGLYWLRLTDSVGCSSSDSIQIINKILPYFSLGTDTSSCNGKTIHLSTPTSMESFHWNTGSIDLSIDVTSTGIYYCDVAKDGCIYRDSIKIVFNSLPIVSLGQDTTICNSDRYALDGRNAGSTYLWQDNTTLRTKNVFASGIYWVQVTLNACSARDSIIIKVDRPPVFTLGPDQFICSGEVKVLRPLVSSATTPQYYWNDGTINPFLSVTNGGLYSLKITNNCGATEDTINFANGKCQFTIPNAFSPNNDGVNDIFKIAGGDNTTFFNIQIYDRYGKKIFETNDRLKYWSGIYNGKELPLGVYYWIIIYKVGISPQQTVLKGSVLLYY